MRAFAFAAALLASLPSFAIAAPPPPAPKLVVAVSVDQYSSELFRRYRASYTDGLATLSRGIAYPVGYQSHAATETCPGHSTILSGRHPAGTGIVANNWFDRRTGSTVYCVAVPGDPVARGPANMRATTLGDWMKAADPRDRVYAVSGKDRAAITMAGHRADGVWWWEDGRGFVTSPAAGPATPAVTGPARAFDAATFAHWRQGKPMLWPQPSPACAGLAAPHRFGQLDVTGEVPPAAALRSEEPTDFMATDSFRDALRASPLFDTLAADFAIATIARQRLGRGAGTDLLAVSLSATDYIGHRFGNGGAEMCVQQAALDATLGRLMDAIRATGVPALVVLTADHGATDAAEREQEHDPEAARLDSAALVAALNKAMREETGLGYDPIVGDDPQQLTVNVGTDAALAARVRSAAVAWLKRQPQVRVVLTADEVAAATVPPGTPPDRLTIAQRFHESFDPARSGDIAVAYAARTSFGLPRSPGDVVAGHGSPWDHDRQVPILFWWPGVTPEDRPAPAETVDIAPTLAKAVGVATPAVDGRVLELGAND
ncbi:alkaline phosphatase family protein [Sphingomonas sp.]|uniref:alkaline phosphatase family protein n=1 Tax=Sphingomonas sp. TaxID=28214 RepID=UPI003B00349A